MLGFGLPLLERARGITVITFQYHLSGKGKAIGQLESEKEDTFMRFDLDLLAGSAVANDPGKSTWKKNTEIS